MTSLKSYEIHKIGYNSLNFWDLEISNSLKKATHQCASVDTLLVSFELKMSTKSSKIACNGKNFVLKGGRSLVVLCALLSRS
jgi:hypothetical protein